MAHFSTLLTPIYPPKFNLGMSDLLQAFISNWLWFVASGGILEEPIFRGFLWGFLKRSGWTDILILFFQAFLFMVSHLNHIDHPITFWLVGPSLGVILGVLALRSKSILPPIVAHSLYNAYMLTYTLR